LVAEITKLTVVVEKLLKGRTIKVQQKEEKLFYRHDVKIISFLYFFTYNLYLNRDKM